MNDDGRLELDELGQVVGAEGGVPADVLADSRRPAGTGRLTSSRGGAWLRRHRRPVTRVAVVGGAVVLVAISLTTSGPDTASLDTRVVGVSLTDEPEGDTGDVLIATYRVATSDPSLVVTVDRVVGWGIRASARRTGAGATGLQEVTALPDCAGAASLGRPASGYWLDTTGTDAAGHVVHRRLPAPDGPVDWASSVRRACWTALASRALTTVHLAASVAGDRSRVTLDVRLRNALGRDVDVRAVDIADVSTLAAADGGVIRTDASRVFRVRVPVQDCTGAAHGSGSALGAMTGPATVLSWAVGPPGDVPIAVVPVPLSSVQSGTLARAVGFACGSGPGVALRVLEARPAPSVSALPGVSGVSLDLVVAVRSDASRLVLGDDTSGLTADARVAFPAVPATPRRGVTTVTLRWNTSCVPGGSEPPVLRVQAVADGRTYARRLTLSDGALARAVADSCSVDPRTLESHGWPAVAPG